MSGLPTTFLASTRMPITAWCKRSNASDILVEFPDSSNAHQEAFEFVVEWLLEDPSMSEKEDYWGDRYPCDPSGKVFEFPYHGDQEIGNGRRRQGSLHKGIFHPNTFNGFCYRRDYHQDELNGVSAPSGHIAKDGYQRLQPWNRAGYVLLTKDEAMRLSDIGEPVWFSSGHTQNIQVSPSIFNGAAHAIAWSAINEMAEKALAQRNRNCQIEKMLLDADIYDLSRLSRLPDGVTQDEWDTYANTDGFTYGFNRWV
jgi:hypothetical protein